MEEAAGTSGVGAVACGACGLRREEPRNDATFCGGSSALATREDAEKAASTLAAGAVAGWLGMEEPLMEDARSDATVSTGGSFLRRKALNLTAAWRGKQVTFGEEEEEAMECSGRGLQQGWVCRRGVHLDHIHSDHRLLLLDACHLLLIVDATESGLATIERLQPHPQTRICSLSCLTPSASLVRSSVTI